MKIGHDKVILLEPTPLERTASGLEIPQNAQKPYNYGLIVLLGPECKYAKVGEVATFDPAFCTRMFVDKINRVCVVEVPEQALGPRFTKEEAEEFKCTVADVELDDVFSRMLGNAVPLGIGT